MQPTTRSSKQPLGGIRRDWRRRFLRFYVPLALASALVLVLFIKLPSFDRSAYPALDMHSSGPFPQAADMDMEDMEMDDGGDGAEQMDDGGDGAEQMDDGNHGGDEPDRTGGHS